ncbi:hypothetical protein SNE40_003585 [Patella caerulea]|uniref:Uncharacterized protein n=1 Tax=Patella caerulea TaxID=87958 RepID=A0AAN8Q0Z5_PATCE
MFDLLNVLGHGHIISFTPEDVTNPTFTSTSKDSALTVTAGNADSLNSIYAKDVNGLSEPSNNIASTDPQISNLIQTDSRRSHLKPKVVRTVTIQPAEFTIGQPADSVTPLTSSPRDLYSAFETGPSADNALLNSVDMQIQGSNMQMRNGNMQMPGGNMQMNMQMPGGNMRVGGGTIGGNMQMTGGDIQRNGGSRQMTGRDMQIRDRNMQMRDRNMNMRDRSMQMRGRNRQINGGTRPMRRGNRRVIERSRNVNGGNRNFNVGRGRFNDGTRRRRNRPIFNPRRQYNRNTNSRTSSTRQFNQRRRPGLVNNYDSTMNARSTESGSCMKKNSFLGLPSEHVCRCEPFKLYLLRAVKPI